MSKEFTITKIRSLLEADERFREKLRRAIESGNPQLVQQVLARESGASSSQLVSEWDELAKTNAELRNVRMSGSFLKAAITKALRKGFAVLMWSDVLDDAAQYGEENPEGDPVRARLQVQAHAALIRQLDTGFLGGSAHRTAQQQRADRRLHIITSADDISNLGVWYRLGIFNDTNPVLMAIPRSVIPRNWVKGHLSGGMWT